jgi:DNA-binding response OmpR family regulator
VSKPGKILIVEDQDVLARNLQTYLRRLGWETRIAGTGESALIAAIDFRPGIVLLDYFLPDMNGFEILQAIRAQHCCACILMTGHPEHVVLADARRLGVAHILGKPFSMAELNSAFWTSAAQYCVRCFQDRADEVDRAAA